MSKKVDRVILIAMALVLVAGLYLMLCVMSAVYPYF